jgi:hypothetical protein
MTLVKAAARSAVVTAVTTAMVLAAGRALAQEPAPDPNRWAIVVGAGDYEATDPGADKATSSGMTNLAGPANDAHRIAEILRTVGRFRRDHVLVHADRADAKGRKVQPATRIAVLKSLATVAKNAKGGFVLFFFAGHGTKIGERAFLLPTDVLHADKPDGFFEDSALELSRVRERIASAKASEVVLFLDACRTGPSAIARGDKRGVVLDRASVVENLNVENSVLIYAADAGQPAFEAPQASGSAGVFSEVLGDLLSGKEPLALDSNGQVTYTTLVRTLGAAVARKASRLHRVQHPEFSSSIHGDIAITFPGRSAVPSVGTGPAGPTEVEATPEAPAVEDNDAAASVPAVTPPLLAPLRLRLARAAVMDPRLLITRNGESAKARDLETGIAVPVSRQKLAIKLPGHKTWQRDVDVPAAGITLNVDLDPSPGRLVTTLVGVAGALTFGAGAFYGYRAFSLSRDLENCRQCDWTKDHLGEIEARRGTYLKVASWSMGVGGILAALSGYHLWRNPPLSPSHGVTVEVAPNGAHLAIAGSY